ncbi:FlgO family outer membrane protein [Shewanella sp. 125m-1]
MYKPIIFLSLLLTFGCASTEGDNPAEQQMANGYGLPHTAAINHLSQQMANELVRQNDSLRPNQPLLVATPVLVSDMTLTNALALQYQQGLIAALHDHQFNLVDINVSDALKVTADGEFIMSRDWQQLSSDLPVENVVVSTMSLSTQGVAINSRIVNVTNNRVVSAAQGFVNAAAMPGYIRVSEKVVSENGLLYRNNQGGLQSVKIVGDK